jgi:hypothetical protein
VSGRSSAEELSLDVAHGESDDEFVGSVGAVALAVGVAGTATVGPGASVSVELVAADDAAVHLLAPALTVEPDGLECVVFEHRVDLVEQIVH